MAIDMRIFIKNRETFPPEELVKYKEEWIAWNTEGTSIVAHSPVSEEAVFDLVVAAGYDLSQCVFSYVPDPDITNFGGLLAQ